MTTVNFGPSEPYGSGLYPTAAMNGQLSAVEVHNSEKAGDYSLYYSVGSFHVGGTSWSDAHRYDHGIYPDVAINGFDLVVEVHRSEQQNDDSLWYHVGTLQKDTVNWGPSLPYGNGVKPSVAVNARGLVVGVHSSSPARDEKSPLLYQLGRVSGETIAWSPPTGFGYGLHPRVALNNDGVVVEVHSSLANDAVYYHLGHISDDKIAWGPLHKFASGEDPSVALRDDGFVLEVHKELTLTGLSATAGQVSGDTLRWSSSPTKYDNGGFPCISLVGEVGLEVHQAAFSSTLWYHIVQVT